MERSQAPPPPPPPPKKSSSFAIRHEKHKEPGRSLSFGSIRFEDPNENTSLEQVAQVEEEEEEEEGGAKGDDKEEPPPHANLSTISDDVDEFIAALHVQRTSEDEACDPPEVPESVIEKFAELLEKEIAKYESGEAKLCDETDGQQQLLFNAVRRASTLMSALVAFSSSASPPSLANAINITGGVLHHAATLLEEEFCLLLQDADAINVVEGGGGQRKQTKRPPSFARSMEAGVVDRCCPLPPLPLPPPPPSSESSETETILIYSEDTIKQLQRIAAEMVAAGYSVECMHVFTIARLDSLEASLHNAGFEKMSIDDVQRMAWEPLEMAIAAWIKAFRHAFAVAFPKERELCEAVFPDRKDMAEAIFRSLANGIIIQFLDFAEAIAMTKRAAEKLFKVLDVYQALREAANKMDRLFTFKSDGEEEEEEEEEEKEEESVGGSFTELDLKAEMVSVRARLGEAAVAIFCDLESSIRADAGKTPVPGGAVHPLTRYVMNYLKYACEYKTTLEHVFWEHKKPERLSSIAEEEEEEEEAAEGKEQHSENNNSNSYKNDTGNSGDSNRHSVEHLPFAAQVTEIMEMLQTNLDSKSKLYKDQALSNIFLMNNGRYIMQKVKGSEGIEGLMGAAWCRRRSGELRQYHKNYQRETWGKVLGCLREEGLQANGKVMKPVLKERFKAFNGIFEEIHRTQSSWVVSDKQLQSELRVSVSAVVVPAYRSFLGRFHHYFTPGRQTEKYVKYGADDLENFIDELFDGTPASMVRRRT